MSELFEHHGREFKVEIVDDPDHGPPWENDCGRGIVSEWTTREKQPWEKVLARDHGSYRYFDVQATMAKAKEDGWMLNERDLAKLTARLKRKPTKGEIRAATVEREFDFLYGWCNDQWNYVGVSVTDVESGEGDSLWGVESNDREYLEVVRDELASGLHPLADVDHAAVLSDT